MQWQWTGTVSHVSLVICVAESRLCSLTLCWNFWNLCVLAAQFFHTHRGYAEDDGAQEEKEDASQNKLTAFFKKPAASPAKGRGSKRKVKSADSDEEGDESLFGTLFEPEKAAAAHRKRHAFFEKRYLSVVTKL